MKTKLVIILTSFFAFLSGNDNQNIKNLPEFIEIIDAHTTITEERIVSIITVKKLPEKLTFYNRNLDLNSLEYKWASNFDIDNDERIDYEFSISSFKFPTGTDTEIYGSIIENTQQNVWKRKNSKATIYLVPIIAKIRGNSIILEFELDETSELKKITKSSKITYSSYYNNGETKYEDQFE